MVRPYAKDDCPRLGTVNEDLYQKKPTPKSRGYGLFGILQPVHTISRRTFNRMGINGKPSSSAMQRYTTTPREQFVIEPCLPEGATVIQLLEEKLRREENQSLSNGQKGAKISKDAKSSPSVAKDSTGSSSDEVSTGSFDSKGPMQKIAVESPEDIAKPESSPSSEIEPKRILRKRKFENGAKNSADAGSSPSAIKDSTGSSSDEVSTESIDTSGTQVIAEPSNAPIQNIAVESPEDSSKTESTSSANEPKRILRKRRAEEKDSIVPTDDREDTPTTSVSNGSDDGNSEGSQNDQDKKLRRTTRVIRPVKTNVENQPAAKKAKPIFINRHDTMTMEVVARYKQQIYEACLRMTLIHREKLIKDFFIQLRKDEKKKGKNKKKKISDKELKELLAKFEVATMRSKWTCGKLKEKDISNGKEEFKVKAYDYTNSEKPIAEEDFEYIAGNDVSGLTKPLPETDKNFMVHCNCEGDCDINCPCVKNSIVHGNAVIINNRIFVFNPDYWQCAVIACGKHCNCSHPECSNSLKKSAASKDLELVRYDEKMGYAVRTKADITTGAYAFDFDGEVKDTTDNVSVNYSWKTFDTSEPKSMDGLVNICQKILNLEEPPPEWTTSGGKILHIDPYKKGNIGRFVSHAESPNCIPIRVFENDLRPEMARLVFVAVRPIPKNTELFVDYGSNYDLAQCLCGTVLCGDRAELLRLLPEEIAEKLVNAALEKQDQEIANLISDSIINSSKTIDQLESDILKIFWLFNCSNKVIDGPQLKNFWKKFINSSPLAELILRGQV